MLEIKLRWTLLLEILLFCTQPLLKICQNWLLKIHLLFLIFMFIFFIFFYFFYFTNWENLGEKNILNCRLMKFLYVLRSQDLCFLHYLGTNPLNKFSFCVSGSISSQARTSAREQKLYAKLKALNRYHRRNGVEAVLHKKAMERRASVSS